MDLKQKLEPHNDKNQNVKAICNSKVYINNLTDKIPILYYRISWKSYVKFKNIQKQAFVIIYLI